MTELIGDTASEVDNAGESKNLKKLEAILFIAGRFLGVKDLVLHSDLNPVIIKDLMEKLVEKYNNADGGLQIVQKGELWKMDVRTEYVNLVNKIATGSTEFSSAEQETLAVIAYKQPIKQSVLIKIRGNKAYDHIHNFIDLGLVVAKRFGRTYMLSLSEEFYDYFNVVNASNPLQESLKKEGFKDE